MVSYRRIVELCSINRMAIPLQCLAAFFLVSSVILVIGSAPGLTHLQDFEFVIVSTIVSALLATGLKLLKSRLAAILFLLIVCSLFRANWKVLLESSFLGAALIFMAERSVQATFAYAKFDKAGKAAK